MKKNVPHIGIFINDQLAALDPYRYPWGIDVLLLDQDCSPILLQQELAER